MMSDNESDAFAQVEDQPVKRGRGRPKKEASESAGDKPPKRPHQPTVTVKGWSRAAEIEGVLFKYLQGISLGVSFLNDVDGQIISNGAADLAHELVELGKVDRRMRSMLESIAAPGKYGGLILASGAIIVPIAINHNLIPQLDLGSLTKNAVKKETDLQEGEI